MTLTADFTRRLPAETLNEIIACVDERKDLHATAHVCRRWRHVAFDHTRQFCWFKCSHQVIPSNCIGITRRDAPSLQLALAKLKCRLNHSRRITLQLPNLEADIAHDALKYLAGCITWTSDLEITWATEAHTQAVFDTLVAHPAPLLTNFVLRRRAPFTTVPQIPSNILAGSSPVLRRVFLTGVDLPKEPLPQFSTVTTVSFDPPAHRDTPWDFQDRFSQHFPLMDSIMFPVKAVVRLAAPSTPEGTLLMARLTSLRMNERMLLAVLDERPELAAIPHISVYACSEPVSARTLDRLLAHFAHDDFAVEARHTSHHAWIPANVVLSSDEPSRKRRDMDVPLAAISGVFERARAAAHELRLVRAVLAGGAFAALWPGLPPECLRSVQIYADKGLPGVPPKTPPRTLPVLRDFIITRRRYTLSGPAEHITLRGRDLSKFVRTALGVPDVRVVTLRLEGVSVDAVTPAVQRMFANVIQEQF